MSGIADDLAVPYPKNARFRWKDQVKAWQDESGAWRVRWSSRFAVGSGEYKTYGASAFLADADMFVAMLNSIQDFAPWECPQGGRPRGVSAKRTPEPEQ